MGFRLRFKNPNFGKTINDQFLSVEADDPLENEGGTGEWRFRFSNYQARADDPLTSWDIIPSGGQREDYSVYPFAATYMPARIAAFNAAVGGDPCYSWDGVKRITRLRHDAPMFTAPRTWINDSITEGTEVFYLTASNLSHGTIVQETASITVADTSTGSTVTLQTLGFTNNGLPVGSPENTYIGFLTAWTEGSTLSLTNNDGGRVKLVGNEIYAGATGAGTRSFQITETKSGAAGSPKVTTINYPVTATAVNIERDGLVIPVSGHALIGEYVDGSIWVLGDNVTFGQPTINPVETKHLYIGGAMIDPGSPSHIISGKQRQGWENRSGMIVYVTDWYSSSAGVTFPTTINTAGGTKTIWFYRGRDLSGPEKWTSGGGSSACHAMVQITVVSAAPAANAIKPPGCYVAGGKFEITTDDINYDEFTPVTIPTGAREPVWSQIFGYRLRPYQNYGEANKNRTMLPKMYETDWGGSQTAYDGQLVMGALSTSASRIELINRLVRDALEIEAGCRLHSSGYSFCAGKQAQGEKVMRYLGARWLKNATQPTLKAAMFETPDPVDSDFYPEPIEFFHIDGAFHYGEPVTVDSDAERKGWANLLWPAGKPMFKGGYQVDGNVPNLGLQNNSLSGDLNGIKEPYWMPRAAGTVVSATSNTVTLDTASVGMLGVATDPTIWVDIGNDLTSSPPSPRGQAREVVGQSGATITVNLPWTTIPTPGTPWEHYAAGTDYVIKSAVPCNWGAGAIIMIGAADDWITRYGRLMIDVAYRFYFEQGKPTPRFWKRHFNTSLSYDVFGIEEDNYLTTARKWTTLFFQQRARPVWPT